LGPGHTPGFAVASREVHGPNVPMMDKTMPFIPSGLLRPAGTNECHAFIRYALPCLLFFALYSVASHSTMWRPSVNLHKPFFSLYKLVQAKKHHKKSCKRHPKFLLSALLSDESESPFSLFHLFTCASWKVKSLCTITDVLTGSVPTTPSLVQ
jgi:hypothetical protein